MARRKRTSKVLNKAERRAAAMGSISQELDLGNGMTLNAYRQRLNALRDQQNHYNRLLSKVDQTYNDLLDAERELAEWSDLMLRAVAVVYGRSSSQYEMAGGCPLELRRRRSQVNQRGSLAFRGGGRARDLYDVPRKLGTGLLAGDR
jgi:hypothetical protein